MIYRVFTITLFLQSVNVAILNFLYEGWKLFIFTFFGNIIVLIILSIVLTAILKIIAKTMKRILFWDVMKRTAVSLSIPS